MEHCQKITKVEKITFYIFTRLDLAPILPPGWVGTSRQFSVETIFSHIDNFE